jgi:hypothetical protein
VTREIGESAGLLRLNGVRRDATLLIIANTEGKGSIPNHSGLRSGDLSTELCASIREGTGSGLRLGNWLAGRLPLCPSLRDQHGARAKKELVELARTIALGTRELGGEY